MSGELDERDLSRALAGLRDAARRQAGPPPAAAGLRRWAERRRTARRAASAMAAAAAVTAVVAGGVTVVRGEAAPPPQPASPGPDAPTPTPELSPSPVPPAPNDPITRVAWASATLVLPTHAGCPSGTVALTQGQSRPRTPGGVKLVIESDSVGYGDLDGDGRPEAVLFGNCMRGEEDSGDGQGRLLAVRRDASGRLAGIGWFGPRGAIYSAWWIAQRRVYTDVRPWHVPWGFYSLGAARGYRLSGASLVEIDASSAYPGLVPAPGRPGAPIDLSPVADLLSCPEDGPAPRALAELRLGADGTGAAGGVRWSAGQPQAPDTLPHLVDLDGDGIRRLMVALSCEDGPANLVTLERTAAGYRAVAVVPPRDEWQLFDWRFYDGALTLAFSDGRPEERYRWTGSKFMPINASATR